jgi:Sec7-like guanine-nucleotide exchange factor
MDDCLRITFNTFKLPKEGQQVDEVLAPLSLIL